MTKNKVLAIWSSVITEKNSYSYELLQRFLKYYKELNNDDEIIFLNLNKEAMASKVLTNKNIASFFADKDCDKYINQLKDVKKVIICTPMTNFHITATLKNYLDHILVPEKTFSYKYSKKNSSIGLLKNLTVQILVTQGAPLDWYPWGNIANFLEGTWKFIGATVNEPLLVAGTKIEQDKKTIIEFINQYDQKIKILAKNFK